MNRTPVTVKIKVGDYEIENQIPQYRVKGLIKNIETSMKCTKCKDFFNECLCNGAKLSLDETKEVFKEACDELNLTLSAASCIQLASRIRDIKIVIDYWLPTDKMKENDVDTLEKVDKLNEKINELYINKIKSMSTESLERLIKTAKQCNRLPMTVDAALSEITERTILREET